MKVFSSFLAVVVITLVMISCSTEEENIGEGGSAPEQRVLDIAAPVFSATDQNGDVFTSSSLKGSPWIVSFFFTSCQTVCPRLNDIQRGFQEEYGNDIKFVSISTDPENDDVAALRTYADEYGAIDGTWWLVRLPHEEMRMLASEGFKLIGPQDPAMHSTRFVAVNANMKIQGFFDSEDAVDVEKLKQWMKSQQ